MDYTLTMLDPEGETLDRLESTSTEWGTPKGNLTTYRDYEQAGMAVTYHDGEPVTTEEPAVEWDAYPASWDEPVLHFSNHTYLDLHKRRGAGGNYPDRELEIRYRMVQGWFNQARDGVGGEIFDAQRQEWLDDQQNGTDWS